MSFKFLLDENMPFDLIECIRNKGYEANHLKIMEKGGIKNGEVYKIAQENDYWILTRDSDFKNYQKFIIYDVKGIIVLALSNTKTQNLISIMKRFLETQHDKLLSKHLIIIEDSNIKVYE